MSDSDKTCKRVRSLSLLTGFPDSGFVFLMKKTWPESGVEKKVTDSSVSRAGIRWWNNELIVGYDNLLTGSFIGVSVYITFGSNRTDVKALIKSLY